MGAGHSHALYVHEHSLIHRLPSETKLVAVAAFVVTVALTPREAIPAFAGYAILIGSVAGLARIPLKFMAARL
ncbi:MAG: cobalt ECF transporter T component CbiQ, partial [Acidimicrobiia bacterium]